MIGPGTHRVRVVHAQTTKTLEKEGKPSHLKLTLGFGNEDGQIGRDLHFSAAAKNLSADQLKRIGITDQHLASVDFWRNPHKYLTNVECQIVCEEREDQPGQIEVKWINSLYGGIAATEDDFMKAALMFSSQ